jgi:WD40-like Beta Propeller Repeat
MKPAVVALTLVMFQPAGATRFLPWGTTGLRTVNAVEFNAEGSSMIVALFTADVAKAQGTAIDPAAPEIALYESRRQNDGWSVPERLPFSGRYKDYEGTLSPDGRTMVFNSWRPLPDGRSGKEHNNLWLARRTGTGWSTPVYLSAINRLETEEAYAAIGPDGRMVFLGEGPADANGVDYNLYETRISGEAVRPATPFPPASSTFGESDPWFARDGSYVIFTRWDRAKKWEEDVDLYITFERGAQWTEPVPLSEINDPQGPDYAVSIAGSPERIYWKRRGGTFEAPFAPILGAARARALK